MEPGRKRDFVTIDYSDGEVACTPVLLPCGSTDACCLVFVHSTVDRVHGVSHPLAVFGCRHHRRYFTAYPPGFSPWSRTRVTADPQAQTGLFDVAYDTAGVRDDLESSLDPARVTVLRRLRRAASLLGLLASSDTAEKIGLALDLALGAHHESRVVFRGARRWATRAQVIVDLLARLALRTVTPFLVSGYLAGTWGLGFKVADDRSLWPVTTRRPDLQ